MNDTNTPLQVIKDHVKTFVAERDWDQFHQPKNLAMNLACEAAELMELVVWQSNEAIENSFKNDPTFRQQFFDEMGDIIISLAVLANRIPDCDLTTLFMAKLEKTKARYTVEASKGSYEKR
jgi:NTP pyrophosphatase (non-canonical NTP hydrolase)